MRRHCLELLDRHLTQETGAWCLTHFQAPFGIAKHSSAEADDKGHYGVTKGGNGNWSPPGRRAEAPCGLGAGFMALQPPPGDERAVPRPPCSHHLETESLDLPAVRTWAAALSRGFFLRLPPSQLSAVFAGASLENSSHQGTLCFSVSSHFPSLKVPIQTRAKPSRPLLKLALLLFPPATGCLLALPALMPAVCGSLPPAMTPPTCPPSYGTHAHTHTPHRHIIHTCPLETHTPYTHHPPTCTPYIHIHTTHTLNTHTTTHGAHHTLNTHTLNHIPHIHTPHTHKPFLII